jgi:N-acetylglucosaminyldiphosphoundecaprenol N-acetyl-beta-D-mannosaminyltransferase
MAGQFSLLGTPVTLQTFGEAVTKVAGLVQARRAAYVSCANAYSVTLASKESDLRKALDGAAMITADGMSVVWALRLFGIATERVHNDDLLLECCRVYPSWRVFLLGGRVGQPEVVAATIGRLFPAVRIVGSCATPVRPVPEADNNDILDRIRATAPDIVWVALGTPAQDFWMSANWPRITMPMVGCGSLFDLLAGYTLPTPSWMKGWGLQWLHRLRQEPRRLLWRYLYFNSRFTLAVLGQFLRSRLFSQS